MSAASWNTTAQQNLINSVKTKIKADHWNLKLPQLLSYLVLWSAWGENELQIGHKVSHGGVIRPLEFVHYRAQPHPYLLADSGDIQLLIQLLIQLWQRNDEILTRTWRWRQISDLKEKNKDSQRGRSLEQPRVSHQSTDAGEDTDTPGDGTERRPWG